MLFQSRLGHAVTLSGDPWAVDSMKDGRLQVSDVAASILRTMTELALTVLLLGTIVMGGWAQGSRSDQNRTDESNVSSTSTSSAPEASVTISTISPAPSYVIGNGDMLQIAVWKEPDLTNTVPVRSDGMISLPLLNDVQAAGLTPMQLTALLRERLKKYVADPRVAVVVTQTNSHRVFVIGEVLHSGPISLLHDMTVLQALATAGIGQFANTKGIYILRKENGQERKILFNYKRVIKGEAASQNILLQPGDMLVVP